MSKHTPGPWELRDNEIAHKEITVCTVLTAADFPCLDGDDEDPDEQAKIEEECAANAHLIAAAPEMLAALHAALNWFSPPNDSGPFPLKLIADAANKAVGKS